MPRPPRMDPTQATRLPSFSVASLVHAYPVLAVLLIVIGVPAACAYAAGWFTRTQVNMCQALVLGGTGPVLDLVCLDCVRRGGRRTDQGFCGPANGTGKPFRDGRLAQAVARASEASRAAMPPTSGIKIGLDDRGHDRFRESARSSRSWRCFSSSAEWEAWGCSAGMQPDGIGTRTRFRQRLFSG